MIDFTPCGCEKCEARRIEHPPVRAGCACPECQPGSGIERSGRSIGELVKIVRNQWCAHCCRGSVITSIRNNDGSWTNTCEELHVWKTYD